MLRGGPSGPTPERIGHGVQAVSVRGDRAGAMCSSSRECTSRCRSASRAGTVTCRCHRRAPGEIVRHRPSDPIAGKHSGWLAPTQPWVLSTRSPPHGLGSTSAELHPRVASRTPGYACLAIQPSGPRGLSAAAPQATQSAPRGRYLGDCTAEGWGAPGLSRIPTRPSGPQTSAGRGSVGLPVCSMPSARLTLRDPVDSTETAPPSERLSQYARTSRWWRACQRLTHGVESEQTPAPTRGRSWGISRRGCLVSFAPQWDCEPETCR